MSGMKIQGTQTIVTPNLKKTIDHTKPKNFRISLLGFKNLYVYGKIDDFNHTSYYAFLAQIETSKAFYKHNINNRSVVN